MSCAKFWNNTKNSFIFVLVFFLPVLVSAEVLFTEVMYDAEGADTGKEWVEVQNDTAENIDLTAWKFFENDTNHSLVLFSGSGSLSPQGYAIIAENPATFSNEFPSYGGLIFDSSFSLNNSGENLSLKDQNGVAHGSFTYDPTLGGAGNGNTLQKSGTAWQEGTPTPGSAFVADSSGQNTPNNTTNTESNSNTNTSGGNTTPWPIEPQVFVNAGPDRVVVVGATVRFSGQAYGLKKEPLENARFSWNFGDGATREGMVADHIYKYPGEYIVVLDVSSGHFSGNDRARVVAEPSPLSISKVFLEGNYVVSIHNSSGRDIDLSGWIISFSGKQWIIPANTFIAGGKDLYFGNEVTNLILKDGDKLLLSYSNGSRAIEEGQKVAPAVLVKSGAVPTTAKTNSPDSFSPKNNLSSGLVGAQAAFSAGISTPKKYSGLIWFFGVIGLALLSIAGLFFARRLGRTDGSETDRLADEFEIEER